MKNEELDRSEETPINPFKFSTPDQIKDPKEALDLFVDVFRDFYLIETVGNTFINGARGTGKSMMFRIMKPDCQKLRLKSSLDKLNYLGVYVPVKNTFLNVQELVYLNGKEKEHVLNEHFMCIYFAISIFKCLQEEDYSNYTGSTDEIITWHNKIFVKVMNRHGFKEIKEETDKFRTISEVFEYVVETLEEVLGTFSSFIQNLSQVASYSGSTFQYRDFLYPLIESITKFRFLPKDKPVYLLVDDADSLTWTQTSILNTWVSYRSTSVVCFKITTQLAYKTYRTTITPNKIDSPHDYHEINLSDIYTSNPSENYKGNVKLIVERRLKNIAGITVSAEDFFPSDKKQEIALKKKMDELTKQKNYDYAYRNARPDYMVGLPNEYTYSYGGFEQLVHLSSGIIRNFIDVSFKMFDQTVRKNTSGKKINCIPISIQNSEIREYSISFLDQLDKSIEDKHLHPKQVNKFKQLKSLLISLGSAFRLFLVSKASERRKFSFYFDGDVSTDVKDVLDLGVSEGFLHYSTHGSKSGLGRSRKYVLNRMLAPVFKLDPFTFSGYLYLTIENVELSVTDSKKFLKYIEERINRDDEEVEDTSQLKLEL